MRRRLLASAPVALCILVLSSAAPALAQTDAAEQARVRFEEANAAADAEDFVEARRLFEESLALLPRPATAANLAQVLRSMGALLESERVLEAIEAGTYGEMSERLAPLVASSLVEVRADLGVLSIAITGASSASVRVDAADPVTIDAGGREIRVDPGSHLVLAHTDDGRSLERSIHLATREHLVLDLAFPPVVASSAGPSSPGEATSGGEDLGWLGITLGVIGALVVAGVVVGIVLATGPSIDAASDPVWGSASALHW